jgi:hypothetical protein
MSVAAIHFGQFAKFFTFLSLLLLRILMFCDCCLLNILLLFIFQNLDRYDTTVVQFVQTPIGFCIHLGPDESLQGAGAA